MPEPSVAVVILNWNGKVFLEKFLPSVVTHSPGVQIIVADNASSDLSLTFLRESYPQIRIIENKSNEGFCRGYNLALKQVKADYYILLNSDVEVTKDWIEPVIALMESDPKIAVCQPKIRSYHEPEKFEYAGACGGFLDRNGYPFCRGRIFENIEKDHGQYDQPIKVMWATGACFFVRSSVFHELNGLDEDFFAHMEEIDFCWRTWNAGYKVMCCPTSTIYHIGGGTLPKNNPHKTFLNFRNGLFLLHKNMPKSKLLPAILFRLVLDGMAGIKFIFHGHFLDTIEVIKAHFSYYRFIPTLNRKRRTIPHHTSKVLKPYSIVWSYFFLRIKKFSALK